MKVVWGVIVLCFVFGATALAYTESQADRGAEVYAFRCSTCHGDRGQGLTDEFRASWPLEEQNCWTPKCHGSNYPEGGFAIPEHVQGVIGPGALASFPTAEILYDYIKLRMPYQDPDLLSEEERWELTAFLLRENGIPSDGQLLDATTAASIRLRPETPSVSQTLSPAVSSTLQAAVPATPPDRSLHVSPSSSPPVSAQPAGVMRWLWALLVAASIGIVIAVVRYTRSR
ncbi:MAG: c-type cytochrome [Anaerolineales bacterium]|nr:MAG: c-type cytochrome [Anaerolineales bacterium]